MRGNIQEGNSAYAESGHNLGIVRSDWKELVMIRLTYREETTWNMNVLAALCFYNVQVQHV